MSTRSEVYAAIDSEREYQDRVWGENNPNPALRSSPGPLSIGEELLLLEEYVARARVAWTGMAKPELGSLEIVRKIAGIAVRCMESHGAPHRERDSR